MDKKEFERIVKAHFAKYGFSEKVLGEVMGMIEPDDLGEKEEADIIKLCESFEPLAKAFQSEVDNRVTVAISKSKSTQTEDEPVNYQTEKGKSTKKNEDEVPAYMKAFMDEIKSLKSEISNKKNGDYVADGLKNIGLTETEIEAAMFGRKFSNQEEADEFIQMQASFKQKLDKEKAKEDAGYGFNPLRPKGDFSKGVKNAQFENFVKKMETKNNLKKVQ